MPLRTGQAIWKGDIRSGSGSLSVGSGAFSGSYSYDSRFAGGAGTNPEELIAAAHAACFSMATASGLTKAGFKPDSITTTATVHLDSVPGGFAIDKIDLKTRAKVTGIDAAGFQKIAEDAKKGCPVSRALSAVEITLDAALET